MECSAISWEYKPPTTYINLQKILGLLPVYEVTEVWGRGHPSTTPARGSPAGTISPRPQRFVAVDV
jgi:hypothetical protein